MSRTQGHDPAYPSKMDGPSYIGMTKLEYFAAMAMAGVLANPNWDPKVHEDPKRVAFTAVDYAEHLIKELEKK